MALELDWAQLRGSHLGSLQGCNQTVAGARITRGLTDSRTHPQTRKTPAAGTPGAGLPVFTWSLGVVPLSVVAARQPDFLHGSAELQSQEPERVPLEAILALLTKPWKSFCVISTTFSSIDVSL